MLRINGAGFNLAILAGGGGGGAALPAQASLVMHFDVGSIAPQADNTAFSGIFTDTVSGITATQVVGAKQPVYRAARLGGKPSIQFTGAKWLTISTPGILKTTIDSGIYTLVIVASNVAAAGTTCAFGSSIGGNSQFYLLDGSVAGRYANNTIALTAPWPVSTNMIVLGAVATKPYTIGSGTGLERIYIQGGCVASGTNAAPVSNGTGGTFAIGARDSGGTLASKLDIHDILLFDAALSPSEMLQVQAWVCAKYSQATPWSTASKFVVFDGDSLTSGVGSPTGITGGYAYKVAQTQSLAYGQWSMLAVGGLSSVNMTTKATAEISAIPGIVGVPIRVLADEYYNAKSSGAAACLSNAEAYATYIRSLPNTKLVWGTSTSHSTDPDATRATYNAAIDASPLTYGDAVVALHTDATIGDSAAYAANSATHWSDIVHLNPAGYTIKANLMNAGLVSVG